MNDERKIGQEKKCEAHHVIVVPANDKDQCQQAKRRDLQVRSPTKEGYEREKRENGGKKI